MFGWFRTKASSGNDDLATERATEFFRRGDYVEALRRADAILAVSPQIALSWRFKGECLFQMNRFDEAEACFRRAHEIGGAGAEEVLFWAAFCQRNAGRCDEAASTLRGYIAALPPDAKERRRQAEGALRAFQS
jgi:tetratricopeptide (TPR) repeat protein